VLRQPGVTGGTLCEAVRGQMLDSGITLTSLMGSAERLGGGSACSSNMQLAVGFDTLCTEGRLHASLALRRYAREVVRMQPRVEFLLVC
jgi:hypothetical protein